MAERWRQCFLSSENANVVVIANANDPLVVYAASAYRYTTVLRDDVANEELRARIEPSIVASQLALASGSADTYVITLEPLVIQMYSPQNVNVIELTRLNHQLIEALASLHEHLNLLYLDNAIYRNEIDERRYRPQLDFLRRWGRESLHRSDQFEVVKLHFPSL